MAHTVKDKVKAAYQRDDLLDKRRRLMEAWSDHCNTPVAANGANVVPIRLREA